MSNLRLPPPNPIELDPIDLLEKLEIALTYRCNALRERLRQADAQGMERFDKDVDALLTRRRHTKFQYEDILQKIEREKYSKPSKQRIASDDASRRGKKRLKGDEEKFKEFVQSGKLMAVSQAHNTEMKVVKVENVPPSGISSSSSSSSSSSMMMMIPVKREQDDKKPLVSVVASLQKSDAIVID